MKPVIKFGTKGFLSAMIAMQIAAAPHLFADAADKADRAKVDTKKSARSVKRDVKKAARKATGQDNVYDDVKDEVKDGAANAKDEAKHQTKKVKK